MWTLRWRRRRLREGDRRRTTREFTAHDMSTMNGSSTSGAMRNATMQIGPLGSTIHILRADAGTVAELAAIDWNRCFRRVCLDPVRGLITLMSPSRLHEDLTKNLDDIVDIAGSVLTGGSRGLLSTRLRGQGEPPGTGMEPDCAFYVGESARAFRDVLVGGESAAVAFMERVARPGGRGRDHECRRELGRALRRPRGTGAVAAARSQGLEGAEGRLPRLAARAHAARTRRFGGARRTHAGRRMRGGGIHAAQPDPRRTHGSGGPDRAPATTREREGARGGGTLPLASRSAIARRSARASGGRTPRHG